MQNKFFIDIPTDEILKQRWYRQYDMYAKYICEDIKKSIDTGYDVYSKSKSSQDAILKFVPDLVDMMNREIHEKDIKNWNRFYKKEGYEFLSRENIFEAIEKIINS
jgi:hypothetical protein